MAQTSDSDPGPNEPFSSGQPAEHVPDRSLCLVRSSSHTRSVSAVAAMNRPSGTIPAMARPIRPARLADATVAGTLISASQYLVRVPGYHPAGKLDIRCREPSGIGISPGSGHQVGASCGVCLRRCLDEARPRGGRRHEVLHGSTGDRFRRYVVGDRLEQDQPSARPHRAACTARLAACPAAATAVRAGSGTRRRTALRKARLSGPPGHGLVHVVAHRIAVPAETGRQVSPYPVVVKQVREKENTRHHGLLPRSATIAQRGVLIHFRPRTEAR
jgi:hypothetical protein